MINRVILQGFSVDEPYIHVTAENKMARLRLATTESVAMVDGTTKHITEWHTVIFWGAMADEIDDKAHLPGTPIYVEGALRHRRWKDKQGRERQTVEVAAKTLRILDLSEVENAIVPKVIAEQIAIGEKMRIGRTKSTPKIALAFPAEDPDELPF